MAAPSGTGPVPGEDAPGAEEAALGLALMLLAVALLVCMPKAEARLNRLTLPLLFAFAAGCFWNALDGEFVYDDGVAVARNKDVIPSKTSLSEVISHNFWGEPLNSEASHMSYRPVTTLSFRLTYWLFQPGMKEGDKGWQLADAKGFHIVNVLCHALSTVLFHRVASLLVRRPLRDWAPGAAARVSLLAALLFACHPVHVEAVANVVGHADVLAFLFGMVATLCHLKACGMPIFSDIKPASFRPEAVGVFWLLLQVCFCATATLCKETGWTYYFVCVVVDVTIVCGLRPTDILSLRNGGAQTTDTKHGKRAARAQKAFLPTWLVSLLVRAVVTLGCALAALILRLRVNWAAGVKQDVDFTWVTNPSEFITNIPSRIMTKAWYNTLHLWLLVFPRTLSNDWACASIPIVESFSDLRNLGTAFAFASVLSLGLLGVFALVHSGKAAKKSDDRSPPGLLLGEGLLLMAVLMVVLPLVPASHAFLTVGFTVAERLLYVPSSGFCLLLALLLQSLCRRSRRFLFVLTIPLLAAYVGRTLMRNRDWRSDMALFRSTTVSLPGNCKAQQSYAWSLQYRWPDGSRDAEAEFHYRGALQSHPGFKDPYINLGALLQRGNRPEEAATTFYAGIQNGDKWVSDYDLILHLNLAFQQHRLGRLSEAAKWYRESTKQYGYKKSPYQSSVEQGLADIAKRGG